MTELFQKLFGPRKATTKEIPTVPLPRRAIEDQAALMAQDIKLELPQFVVGCAQSVGRQRDHNEDALFALTTLLTNGEDQTPLGLYIVADGMGGHKHGEVASGLAVRTMGNQVVSKVFKSLLNPQPSPPPESLQEILQDSVQEAHRVIAKHAPGGGTTVTALLLLGQQVTIAHVGDSRAYSVNSKGGMNVLTRDHSLVMRMIELGQLTPEEAAVHPQRNVLYRALGQGDLTMPDISSFPMPKSDYILLCSDGLWGVVPEEEMLDCIQATPDLQVACQLLINAANEHGGPDNITAILIRLPE